MAMKILVEQVAERVYRCVRGHAEFRSALKAGGIVCLTDIETREEVRAYKSPDGVLILQPLGAEIAETKAIAFIERLMREARGAKMFVPNTSRSWRGRYWPRFK